MLLNQENKDPFEIFFHIVDCPEEVWDEDDESGGEGRALISDDSETFERMVESGCAACMHAWTLWDDIIQKCGDPIYGYLAGRAFEMLDWIETFNIPPDKITAEDWEYIRAAKEIRRSLEISRLLQAQEARRRAEAAAAAEG